jgi:hypothetical protein
LAAFLAAGFTSSELSSSDSSSLLSFLTGLAGTPFFTGAAACLPLVGSTLTSSDEDSSEESSLETAFLLTTAFCLSSFLGCLSVIGCFLAPVLDSEVVLGLLSPTWALA